MAVAADPPPLRGHGCVQALGSHGGGGAQGALRPWQGAVRC